jgi:hypothetical protein
MTRSIAAAIGRDGLLRRCGASTPPAHGKAPLPAQRVGGAHDEDAHLGGADRPEADGQHQLGRRVGRQRVVTLPRPVQPEAVM